MNSNVICTNNFSFLSLKPLLINGISSKVFCLLRKIIFSLVSLVRLTVLSVDYPFLLGVINLLVVLFSVSESWHCIVGFWNILLIEPQLNKHHKRDLIMTSVSDSTTCRSKKKLPNIPPEELALHGNGGSLEGGGKPHDLPPEVQAQFIRHVHKRSRSWTGLDTIEFEKKLQAEAEKENVEPKPLLEQSLAAPKQEQLIGNQDERTTFVHSLPSTPGMIAKWWRKKRTLDLVRSLTCMFQCWIQHINYQATASYTLLDKNY